MTVRATAVLLVGVVALGACASAPDSAVGSLRTGIAALREAEAERWAPEEVAAAEAALAAVEDELTRQRTRFAPVRRYGRAEALIAAAEQDLAIVRDAVREGRRLAEEEAREAMATAKDAIDGARTALLLAPVSDARRRSFDRLEDALDRADTLHDEADRLVIEGRYHEATIRAEEILALISTGVRALQDGRG